MSIPVGFVLADERMPESKVNSISKVALGDFLIACLTYDYFDFLGCVAQGTLDFPTSQMHRHIAQGITQRDGSGLDAVLGQVTWHKRSTLATL